MQIFLRVQKWKSCFCVTSHNQVTTIMKSQLNFDMNTMISRDIFKFLILLETWKSRKYFVKSNGRQVVKNRRVFLLHQLWIVNYSVKSSSNNLSNENINTGVSDKTWIKMPKLTIFEISFLWKHQFLCFHYWDYLTNFWHNNWQSIIDVAHWSRMLDTVQQIIQPRPTHTKAGVLVI